LIRRKKSCGSRGWQKDRKGRVRKRREKETNLRIIVFTKNGTGFFFFGIDLKR
jgi:hypothetical protein